MKTMFGFFAGAWAEASPAPNISVTATVPSPRAPTGKLRGVMATSSVLHSGQSTVRLLEREDAFPVSLHIDHGPFVRRGGVQSLVEFAKVCLAIIGKFAFGVGMMDDQ